MNDEKNLPDYEPMPDDWEHGLAIVAHPDDMEFAAAGAVARWTSEGKRFSYVILTKGEAGIDGMDPEETAIIRQDEQRRSCDIVGVNVLEFMDYPDGTIEYGIPLRKAICSAIRRHKPDFVLGYNHHMKSVSGRMNSADHRSAGMAVIDAVADAANHAIFNDLPEEKWPGVKYLAMGQSPHPTHAVDITATLDVAVASLEAHKAYLKSVGLTDVRGPLEHFASMFGKRFGGGSALVFELIPR